MLPRLLVFDVSEFFMPGANSSPPDIDNSTSIGNAVLDDSGLLSIFIFASVDQIFEAPSPLAGNYKADINAEYLISGTLAGASLTSPSVAFNIASCVDTGSTGFFGAIGACSGAPIDTWQSLTDPINFDLAINGLTEIVLTGYPSAFANDFDMAAYGTNTFTLTTLTSTVVPLPAAIWLFGSALTGLVVLRSKKVN